jgi:hypothetical protein
MILPDFHEIAQPRPKPEVLEQLAQAADGEILRSSSDLASLLLKMPTTTGDAVISRQPLWDSPFVWLLILGLLAVEWSLRRMSA